MYSHNRISIRLSKMLQRQHLTDITAHAFSELENDFTTQNSALFKSLFLLAIFIVL